MRCNIDARGRAFRWYSGILCGVSGGAIAAYALRGASSPYIVSLGIALILAGLFQLFESRKGWCAIRAMGLKTPI